MKVLFASTLKRKLGPKVTASRSQIIYQLAQGIAAKGHQVSILATGDSKVEGAKIIPIIPKSFIDLPIAENSFYQEAGYLTKMAKEIYKLSSQFDIIHNHTYPEFINLLTTLSLKTPMVTTIHAQATKELDSFLAEFNNTYLIALSYAQKQAFRKAKIYKVIYNGIDTDVFSLVEKKEDYLLWIGRLSRSKDRNSYFDAKGVKQAIQLAKLTGDKLKLAGSVEDKDFFEKEVRPYLSSKISWIGDNTPEQSLSKKEIVQLMQHAKVYLMTINWEEPFGLVMAEAQSCG